MGSFLKLNNLISNEMSELFVNTLRKIRSLCPSSLLLPFLSLSFPFYIDFVLSNKNETGVKFSPSATHHVVTLYVSSLVIKTNLTSPRKTRPRTSLE